MAPATGGPRSVEKDAKAVPCPFIVLIYRGSSAQIEIATEDPDMIVPELKPRTGRTMEPKIRTDRPNDSPLEPLSIFPSATGKMTPPREDPAMAIPIAPPRFFWKYWGRASRLGNMSSPIIPMRMPWASMNWRHSRQMLVIMLPKK